MEKAFISSEKMQEKKTELDCEWGSATASPFRNLLAFFLAEGKDNLFFCNVKNRGLLEYGFTMKP